MIDLLNLSLTFHGPDSKREVEWVEPGGQPDPLMSPAHWATLVGGIQSLLLVIQALTKQRLRGGVHELSGDQ